MSDYDFLSLQKKLVKLLALHEELRQENLNMRAAEADWQAERARLIQQNEAARRKVNEMIEKMQILERNSGQ